MRVDLNERRCGAWAVGRRGQEEHSTRAGSRDLADKSTTTRQAQTEEPLAF